MKSRNKRFYGGSQERYLQYMKNSERYCGCSRSPRNEEYKEYNEEYRRIRDEMIRKMTGAQLTGTFPQLYTSDDPSSPGGCADVRKPSEIQGLRSFGENCGKYNHGTDKWYFRIGKSGKKMSEFRVIGLRSLPLRQKKTTLYYVICFAK